MYVYRYVYKYINIYIYVYSIHAYIACAGIFNCMYYAQEYVPAACVAAPSFMRIPRITNVTLGYKSTANWSNGLFVSRALHICKYTHKQHTHMYKQHIYVAIDIYIYMYVNSVNSYSCFHLCIHKQSHPIHACIYVYMYSIHV